MKATRVPFFLPLIHAGLLLFSGLFPSAQATVTIEFQLGAVPLPSNSLGILVVDTAGDGFWSPAQSPDTVLEPGNLMGGGDDVIVSVFPIVTGEPFGSGQGFAELVGPLDYRELGISQGQKLIFYAIPSRTPGSRIRYGETYFSFRTDNPGSLIGNMDFSLPNDGGSYILGALGMPQAGSVDFTESLPETPLIGVGDPDGLIVGKEVAFQLEGTGDSNRFIARGLPPGLRLNPITGLVTGRLSRNGDFLMRVWVRNTGGLSGPVLVPMEVASLPQKVVGSFEGSVVRDPVLNDSLGGRLVLRTINSGQLTGRITLGARSYPFRGSLDVNMAGGVVIDPTARIEVRRGRSEPLELSLSFDIDAERVDGVAADSNGGSADIEGFHNQWHRRLNRPVEYEGYYTNLLDLDPAQGLSGEISVPQGNGFLGLRVIRSGIARWVGRMGDGAPISSAGVLGPGGEYFVFRTLYRNTGSVIGTGLIDSFPGQHSSSDENTVGGSWDWLKHPQVNPRQRTYQEGFGPTEPVRQLLSGALYNAPMRGELPLAFADLPDNARLIFTEGGLADAEMNPDLAFQLTPGARGLMPKPGEVDNPARTTFSLNRRTGVVSGGFLLLDTTPDSSRPFKRRAVYQGMILPSEGMGAGWFLLGQLPDPGADPPNDLRTTPILSGQMIVEENIAGP